MLLARRVSGFLAFTFAAQLFAQQNVLDLIAAESLRSNVLFLASDELEGRGTPSPGLDKAADHIAAQFKSAGLTPINESYFQEAAVTGGTARNVVGLLRGSDAELRDSYIIVSAHYDHVGLATRGNDRVFNGANDDASGVASVIELAKALSAARPERSFLFIAFYGEERGLLGSRYYAQHPLVPIAATIAQLNLEQLGRTDASNGPQIKGANLTGFDFSTLPATMAEAAQGAGIRIWKDSAASDAYFGLSDNQALADLGVPAHTLSVAYQFPDYHKVTDSADKLDYENMAAVNRGIVLGLLRLASEAAPPKWNEQSAATARYAEAARKLHAATGN